MSCWLLLPMICWVQIEALRANWPSNRVQALACTEISCCAADALIGLFGLIVFPGPVSQSLHPAVPTRASESASPDRIDLFI